MLVKPLCFSTLEENALNPAQNCPFLSFKQKSIEMFILIECAHFRLDSKQRVARMLSLLTFPNNHSFFFVCGFLINKTHARIHLRWISCWRTASDISSGFILFRLFCLQSYSRKMCGIFWFHVYSGDILLLDAAIDLNVIFSLNILKLMWTYWTMFHT